MTLNWTELLKIAHGIDKDAAASEAKKKALMKKYDLDINNVELASETDPTPNGVYTEWVCREIRKGNLSAWSNSSPTPDHVVTQCLELFTRLKQSPEFQAACKEGKYQADIMKMEFNQLYNTCKNAKQLVSRNEAEKNTMAAFKLWSGEYEGNNGKAKVDVYMFSPEDIGSGGVEAYALVSSGPALDPYFNPLPHTAWCTTQEDTATDYLEDGDAYIIRVNDKNYCNIHEDSQQCMDGTNHTFANNRSISNPVVQFAVKGAGIKLSYYHLGDHTCYICHKPYVSPVADTREGREGKIMCFTCFHKDWTAEIKRYIMNLYNEAPDSFTDEPTTTSMKKWVMGLWDVDGMEHERNFWNPEDVELELNKLGVFNP